MFNIFSNTNISGKYPAPDREKIWKAWAQERAYRIGLVLSSGALVLSAIAVVLNAYYLGPIEAFADALLFLGCLVSIFSTRNRAERYFVWWPMLLGYWIAIQPNIFLTGGISSPFFATFMILLLVGSAVIQTEIKFLYVVGSVLLNILFWIGFEFIHPLGAGIELPAAYNMMLNIDCFIAIAICIYGFLKTETDLAREFEERYIELNTAQESLLREESANASKTAFLANISHELRTPLGAILGYIDLVIDEKYSENELRDHLSIVKRNGIQLSRLVDDLLDLSKIEVDRFELEKLETNLLSVLTEIFEMFSLNSNKKGVEFTVKYLNPIPEKLILDSVRLKQILINVVGNAIKFTEQGKVEVNVEYLDSVEQLKILIRDTGRGLTREEQAKIFQPFTQADASMARKYGGTGLGLSLSRKLSQLMGGDLQLTFSRPGEGSIFALWINAPSSSEALVSDFTIAPPALVTSNTDFSRPLENVNILVVDDTQDNRNLIQKFLELSGATVETAEDGTDGITQALEGDFDLILMDVQMPGLDGLQATSLLRQRNYKKPIVALTAHAMKQDRERCLEAGCSDYLAKPVNRRDLIATVKRLVGPSSAQSSLNATKNGSTTRG